MLVKPHPPPFQPTAGEGTRPPATCGAWLCGGSAPAAERELRGDWTAARQPLPLPSGCRHDVMMTSLRRRDDVVELCSPPAYSGKEGHSSVDDLHPDLGDVARVEDETHRQLLQHLPSLLEHL